MSRATFLTPALIHYDGNSSQEQEQRNTGQCLHGAKVGRLRKRFWTESEDVSVFLLNDLDPPADSVVSQRSPDATQRC